MSNFSFHEKISSNGVGIEPTLRSLQYAGAPNPPV